MRGSQLPESQRMLHPRHGDVHDHGCNLHPALPVLRCGSWPPPTTARSSRAKEPRTDGRGHASEVRGDYVGRPRRPARRGAHHFADCIREVRSTNPGITVEILTSDFRGRADIALERVSAEPPDVFNHNIETVPRLYHEVRPGADYAHSLSLLARFKARHPHIATKSGLTLSTGETREEIEATLHDLRVHNVDMVTIGQYLQPSLHPPAGTPIRHASRIRRTAPRR